MNILSRIKQLFEGKKEPIIIVDETFGVLTLVQFKNSSLNYWSGGIFFKATQTPISCHIHTTVAEKPTSEQRYFFSSFRQNYYSLSKLWQTVIDDEIGENLFEMGFNLNNTSLDEYFKLSHIKIPLKFNPKARWKVTFFAIPEIDLDHEFTIEMEGWDALGLYING